MIICLYGWLTFILVQCQRYKCSDYLVGPYNYTHKLVGRNDMKDFISILLIDLFYFVIFFNYFSSYFMEELKIERGCCGHFLIPCHFNMRFLIAC